jgi:phage/plasmid-like protein (TIGR03299 family)
MEIQMAHEVETMAWANEVPWHGLGANVDPNVSVEEMAEAAGLNWRLVGHPIFTSVDDEIIQIPERQAWIRDSDKKVMTVTGDNWRPMQPVDTIEFMRDYVAAGAAKLETAGSLRGGKIVWGLARLNHDFEVGRGDKVNGYVLITSPNEVGKSITVRTTTVRVVCANTMAMAENNSTLHYRQNHLKDFNADQAKMVLGNAHEQLRQAERNAKALLKLKLSISDSITKVLVPIFHPEIAESPEMMAEIEMPENQPRILAQMIESIERAPGNKEIAGTGWATLNGVTRWADHVAGRKAETRLYNSWIGDYGRRKLEVQDKLLELAA